MDCIKEQEVFTTCQRAKWDSNHKKILNAPPNHPKIRVNLIFAVKYNGRHKARLVADGSLTPEPVENIYSGIVSLRYLRLVIFLGELNNLELWELILGMHIWKLIPTKNYSSLEEQSLRNLKDSS